MSWMVARRRQPEPPRGLLGVLIFAVEELDQQGGADAQQETDQQPVGQVLAQGGLKQALRHKRLVDDADVRLAGVLQARRHFGLGAASAALGWSSNCATGLDHRMGIE